MEDQSHVEESADDAQAIPIPAAAEEEESEAEAEVTHSEPETHVDTESDTVAGSVIADKTGDDLDDMVKFLEFTPVHPRPTSMVVIPDEVADIPDIDEN